MHVAYPLQIDTTGRTAGSSDDAWVRGLIEQLLFTSPGERVMRPDFGSGLLNLVFAPAGQTLAAATQLLVQSALHQWLGALIEVEGVETRYEEGLLEVTVRYVRRSDGERRQVSVARAVA